MTMFSDIEGFLAQNRKKVTPKKKKTESVRPVEDGAFDEMNVDTTKKRKGAGTSNGSIADKITSMLKEHFGAEVEAHVVEVGGTRKSKGIKELAEALGDLDDVDIKYELLKHALGKIYEKTELMVRLVEPLYEGLGIPRSCTDYNGEFLKVGDVLQFPSDGSRKTVLELGYGYCKLSHTDDQAKSDGFWFQSEIKDRKLVKR